MLQRILTLLSAIAVLVLAVTAVTAQDSASPDDGLIIVGIYVSPPFVMKSGGQYGGMAIDLWEALAAKLNLRFEYRELATVRELLGSTASGTLDIAVTNLTITEERATRMDFTHPWFDAGLRLMVSNDHRTSFGDVMTGLSEAGFLRVYAALAAVIVLATIGLTLFDRRFNSDFPRRWHEGLAENFYNSMSIATTGRAPGRKAPFGWLGRILSAFWLVSGVAVVAYVTSTITSVMTASSLHQGVNSLADLAGRDVGVFTGSVAEHFAHDAGMSFRSFANVDGAAAALLEGRIDAIIGDAPVLEFYAHNHPEQTVKVVGPIFEPDKYGFALPQGSPLTKPITIAIISAHEQQLLEDLRLKYFSDAP